jgi:hypothetical protein
VAGGTEIERYGPLVAAINAAFDELQVASVPLPKPPSENDRLLAARNDPYAVEGSVNGALRKPDLSLLRLRVMRLLLGREEWETWDDAVIDANKRAKRPQAPAYNRALNWNNQDFESTTYMEVKLEDVNMAPSLSHLEALKYDVELKDVDKRVALYTPAPPSEKNWKENTQGRFVQSLYVRDLTRATASEVAAPGSADPPAEANEKPHPSPSLPPPSVRRSNRLKLGQKRKLIHEDVEDEDEDASDEKAPSNQKPRPVKLPAKMHRPPGIVQCALYGAEMLSSCYPRAHGYVVLFEGWSASEYWCKVMLMTTPYRRRHPQTLAIRSAGSHPVECN